MDKVTQQDAANAEESASASEELNSQAESMNEVVGELIALVGGAGRGEAMSKPPRQAKGRQLSRSDTVFHRIAETKDTQEHQAASAPSARKPVPLGNDDLKSFNS